MGAMLVMVWILMSCGATENKNVFLFLCASIVFGIIAVAIFVTGLCTQQRRASANCLMFDKVDCFRAIVLLDTINFRV